MMKIITFIIEILRIIVLLAIFLIAVDWIVRSVYGVFIDWKSEYGSYLLLGNFLLFFLLYRNYFQFTGWYKSAANKKLSRAESYALLIVVVIIYAIPPLLEVVG